MSIKNRGMLIVLSGPSGSGKDTIIKKLISKDKNISISVSATTRSPRKGEIDGKDYFFMSREEFNAMIDEGNMIEYTEYCGNYYGTCNDYIRDKLSKNDDIILEIEIDGRSQIKDKYNDCISIFIMPPSFETLETRLMSRGLDSRESVDIRLERAKKEISEAYNYDYIVINDNLNECVNDILTIICAERMKSRRINYVIDEVLRSEKAIS